MFKRIPTFIDDKVQLFVEIDTNKPRIGPVSEGEMVANFPI